MMFAITARPTSPEAALDPVPPGLPGYVARPLAAGRGPAARWTALDRVVPFAGSLLAAGKRMVAPSVAGGLAGDPAQPILTLQDVSFTTASGRFLLEGVDLTVDEGERIAIVGPNGAGKTSMVRLLCGRASPTRGTVSFRGKPLSSLSFHHRAMAMAVVAQSDTPDLRLTLREYVGLGRVPHRGRVSERRQREVVTQAIGQVGLSGLAARRLDTLSGGERQRGAIARAIAQEPRLLILDEPTNHLDPRARADVLALTRELGITVVAVLHDLTMVSPFADRVVVLDRGRLVAAAPAPAALSRTIVRDVFAMDCFQAVNPATGRPLLVFDTP